MMMHAMMAVGCAAAAFAGEPPVEYATYDVATGVLTRNGFTPRGGEEVWGSRTQGLTTYVPTASGAGNLEREGAVLVDVGRMLGTATVSRIQVTYYSEGVQSGSTVTMSFAIGTPAEPCAGLGIDQSQSFWAFDVEGPADGGRIWVLDLLVSGLPDPIVLSGPFAYSYRFTLPVGSQVEELGIITIAEDPEFAPGTTDTIEAIGGRLPGCFDLQDIYGQTFIRMFGEFEMGCDADWNGDGFVDFFDYGAYVACFELQECPDGRNGDFNGDGFVDFFDYGSFVEAFETGC